MGTVPFGGGGRGALLFLGSPAFVAIHFPCAAESALASVFLLVVPGAFSV